MSYLQRCRLEYAKQLLTHGELTIAEIAAITGFFDQSHLSRRFRKVTGMTPGEFARDLSRQESAEPKRTLAADTASAPNVGVSAGVALPDCERLLVALDHRAVVRRNLRV